MFAWSLSKGTGTFTAVRRDTMNPNESVIGESIKFVVIQGFSQVTATVYVDCLSPIVTIKSQRYVEAEKYKLRSFDCRLTYMLS
jgi:hypothetical protein